MWSPQILHKIFFFAFYEKIKKKKTVVLELYQEKWAPISMIKDLALEELSSNSGPGIFLSI